MGGYSSEAHISVKSGQVVAKSISDRFKAIRIKVSKDGWTAQDGDNSYPIDTGKFTYNKEGNELGFDVMFVAIHGTPGEDGKVQKLLDKCGLPYVGSGESASALTFDKGKCNTFLKDFSELNIARSLVLNDSTKIDSDSIRAEIGLPCFVKPCNEGSSYGISKVNTASELLPAIQHAFSFDDSVLVEQFVEGTEVSNGVYELDGIIHNLPITEIVPEGSFFDYAAKYEGSSKEITPARISPEMTRKIQKMSKIAFGLLGLKGMARIDYIIKGETPYLIEPNTVPGLSEQSILPQQVKEAGMSLSDFFGKLIDDALDQAN